MKTLAETLNKQLNTPTPAPTLGQTEQAQGLLRAKVGAGQTGTEGPRRSSIQETAAAQDTQSQLAQGALSNKLQGKQLLQAEEEQAVKTEQQFLNLNEDKENMRAQMARQTAEILNQFESGIKQLDSQKDKAALEQVGFMLRLQDDKYVADLNQNAQRIGLENDLKFKEEITRAAFEDDMDIFKNNIEFQTFMNMDRRQFEVQVAQMDINYAMQLASRELDSAKTQQLFTGVGNLATAGLSYMEKQEDRAALQKQQQQPKAVV
jgi:hypothetical protein